MAKRAKGQRTWALPDKVNGMHGGIAVDIAASGRHDLHGDGLAMVWPSAAMAWPWPGHGAKTNE